MKCSYFSSNAPGPTLDNTVKAKVLTFLEKLQRDDASPGLHIEKMNNPADARARTGRVDGSWRAVLYQLDTKVMGRVYVYDGTWPHDDAIKRAKTKKLNYNIVNGLAEFIEVAGEITGDDSSNGHSRASTEPGAAEIVLPPFLDRFGFVRTDLTEQLGFDEVTAGRLWDANTEDAALDVAAGFPNAWQRDAAVALICGDAIGDIRASLGLDERIPIDPDDSEDDQIAQALLHPASKMQFTFVSDDEELTRIIDEGDFGAWRVFLHPEQAKYATQRTSGPFRLTGGAGTGKTVVLLHRAKHLAASDPNASIVLTTYTRALGDNLKRDLHQLDASIPIAEHLGDHGVMVRGINQLSVAVREMAGASSFADAAVDVLGYRGPERIAEIVGSATGWEEAAAAVGEALPPTLRSANFLEGEYLHVVLANQITTLEGYLSVRRPGRKIALDRRRRSAVWAAVEQYRSAASARRTLAYEEVASIAARWLELHPDSAAHVDHVLVDEAQDLTPPHWQLLRALARQGADDLFIAEDTHQRIYGQHITFAHHDIKVVGRSRRLRLNYRTTEQNLGYAMGILANALYRDSDGELEVASGYRSLRRGPMPEPVPTDSREDLDRQVAAIVGNWLEEGVEPSSIALLARTNEAARRLKESLHSHGIEVNHVKAATGGGDRPITMTMHTSKGMEFSRVVLYDVSEGVMPSARQLALVAEEEREDLLIRERSLLYVAASRARDVLVVTWRGRLSPLLGDLRVAGDEELA